MPTDTPPPFRVPGLPNLGPDTTIGEIAQKIGRKISLEQDTMVHKFAETHPDVVIDDLVICHGQFLGENDSNHYRIWVEVMTPEEKAQRDAQRKSVIHPQANLALVLMQVLLWTQPNGQVREGLPQWMIDSARSAINTVSKEALVEAEKKVGFGLPGRYSPVTEWFKLP